MWTVVRAAIGPAAVARTGWFLAPGWVELGEAAIITLRERDGWCRGSLRTAAWPLQFRKEVQ